MIVTRFAPSPNGPLHLGHAFSAIVAHDLAQARGGRFLLRIEDIDGARSRAELADEFRADLAWLGLDWDEVRAAIGAAGELRRGRASACATMGLLYPCRCTRAEIAAAAAAHGPDGPVYPGTCRGAAIDPASRSPGGSTWPRRCAAPGRSTWTDELRGRAARAARAARRRGAGAQGADTPASYHLAATLDDAADGVTLVTRGHGPVRRQPRPPAAAGAARPAGADAGTTIALLLDADGTQARQAARLAVAGRPAPRGRGRPGAGRRLARAAACPLALRLAEGLDGAP